MTKNTVIHMLKDELFPITLEAFRADNNELVWKEVVEKPETFISLYVPPLRKIHNVEIIMHITYGNGSVYDGEGNLINANR